EPDEHHACYELSDCLRHRDSLLSRASMAATLVAEKRKPGEEHSSPGSRQTSAVSAIYCNLDAGGVFRSLKSERVIDLLLSCPKVEAFPLAPHRVPAPRSQPVGACLAPP